MFFCGITALIVGCETNAQEPLIEMTTGSISDFDNNTDGSTDVTEDARVEPDAKVRLTCNDLCRLTVTSPSGYVYDTLFVEGGQLTLKNFQFSGVLEFPVQKGTLIDLWIEFDGGSAELNVLKMRSPLFLLQKDYWGENGLEVSYAPIYLFQVHLEAGEVMHHFRVVSITDVH